MAGLRRKKAGKRDLRTSIVDPLSFVYLVFWISFNSKECLSVAAYQSLDLQIKQLNPLYDCCSYCTALCKCGRTSCETSGKVLPF